MKAIMNREAMQVAANYALIATCLVLPVATGLLSAFTILTILFWIISCKFKDILHIIKSNLIVQLATILTLLFSFGIFYSSAGFSEALSYLKKYRELIFFPIIILLLQNDQLARKRCVTAFLIGCVCLLLISFCMYFSIIPSTRYGNSPIYHITHNFFMSILAFFAIHRLTDAEETLIKFSWGFIFLLSVINMFYIAPGRTGMLAFLFLMILFFVQRFSWLKQIISLIVLAVLLTIAFKTSDNFSSRSKLAIQEIQKYEYGASRTSMGMRFDWWINTIKIIKEKPILGHGTGSFKIEHDRFISGSKMVKTDNPHNEYLFIGVQLGFTGLVIFVLLFFTQLYYSFKLERPDAYLVQGVIIAMMIGCIMNSFLFDTHQGHFWAILSAVFFSALPQDDRITG